MKYIQVKITTTHEGAEILTGVLMNAGINDISIHDPDEIRAMLDCVGEGECYDSLQVPDNDDRDVTLSVFLPDTKEGIRKASEIKQRVGRVREDIGGLIDLGWLDVTASTTDDASWRDKWKDYFVPFRVTESIVVKPTWRKYEPLPGDLVIELDPGMAFGTGSHETTSLAMKMMEKYIKKGDRVLDVDITKKALIKVKTVALCVFVLLYTVFTFCSVCLLETEFNLHNIHVDFVLTHLAVYVIHGIVCTVIAMLIIGVMLHFKQSAQVAVAVSFIVSFIGVFISQIPVPYLYCVNAMFYISEAAQSTGFEKIVAVIVELIAGAFAGVLFNKISKEEA